MTSQSSPDRLDRSSNDLLEATSFLFGTNAAFVESLYAQYLENPDAVDESWRAYFSSLGQNALEPIASRPRPGLAARQETTIREWRTRQCADRPMAGAQGRRRAKHDLHMAAQESIRAIQLVRAYRVIGHLEADLDPLKITPKQPHPQLDPAFYGFHAEDIDRPIFIDGVMGLESATPRRMTEILKRTYCGRIGYEFMHINDPEQKDWLQRRIEGPDKEIVFTPEGKKAILNKLVEAEGFEKFAGLRFLGTKRFGLDGGEAMIPALEQIIKRGGQLGVKEIVIGMAHRGRLNVLANVMSKPYRQLFHEFSGGSANPTRGAGFGRREISSRRLERPRVRQSPGASVADGQPVASGSVRPRRARQGARQAAAARRHGGRAPASCRCCCTATRPSRARAWSPNASR